MLTIGVVLICHEVSQMWCGIQYETVHRSRSHKDYCK